MLPLLLSLLQSPTAPPVEPLAIGVGETVRGEITADDVVVGIGAVTIHAHSYRLSVAEPGVLSIELRSLEFDALLKVLDEEGRLVAGDEDGGPGLDARIEFDAEADREYEIRATANVGLGPYELEVTAGRAAPRSVEETIEAERENGRARLAYLEERYGERSEEYIRALNRTGEVLHPLGLYQEAFGIHERAFDLSKEVLGIEHGVTQQCWSKKALVLTWLGRGHEAAGLFLELVSMQERLYPADHVHTALTRIDLAQTLILVGELQDAREHCGIALSVLERAYAPNDAPVSVLRTMGILCMFDGDYELAEHYMRRAVAVAELFAPRHRAAQHARGYLGRILVRRGKYGEARVLLEQTLAENLRSLGPHHPDTAWTLAHLAELYSLQGDLDAALEHATRGLAISERAGIGQDLSLGIMDTLAQVHRARGEHREACRILERLVAIHEELEGKDNTNTLIFRTNLGNSLFLLGDLAAAEMELIQAIEGLERNFGPNHPICMPAITGLAQVLAALEDHENALLLYERALLLSEELFGRGHADTMIAMHGLADSLVAEGRAEDAWSLVRAHRADRNEQIGRVLASLTESERFAFLARASLEVERVVDVAAAVGRPEVHEQAYAAVLDWKGWSTRLMLASRERLAAEVGTENLEKAQGVLAIQAELTSFVFDRSAARSAGYDERIAELRRRRNEAELELVRSLGAFAERAPTPARLRECLPEGAAVLDFLAHDHLRVWITRPDRSEVVQVDLGRTRTVEEAVREFLFALHANEEVEAGASLREVLWDPLAPALEGADLIFVSPDGFLGALPFETVPLEDGRYLVEERAFAYIQDASSLARLVADERRPRYDSLLACGGLDYDDRPPLEHGTELAAASPYRGSFTRAWTTLPGTRLEAEAIVERHAAVTPAQGRRLLLTGSAATEDRLERELPRYAVLHLATHGFFQPEGLPSMWVEAVDDARRGGALLRDEPRRLVGLHPGLLTGLVCAGANTDAVGAQGDGYLTAEELQWLDLSNAELVVLSACETAIGQPRAGEGMIGLRRACRLAGASTVVSSLWRVDDDATGELMETFYENLWERGMGRLEALRSAQLDLLRRQHPPSSWGAFVLAGDWR